MHKFKFLAALTLFLTATVASPFPTPKTGDLQNTPTFTKTNTTQPPDVCPDCGPDGQPPVDSCGASTFVDQTSDASPLASDCLHIVQNIQKGGKWNVESVTGRQHQLVQWGTCAFGVQPTDHVGGYFDIGNLDIIDLINTSVGLWAVRHDGKISGWGYMQCGGSLGAHGKSHGVQWGIY